MEKAFGPEKKKTCFMVILKSYFHSNAIFVRVLWNSKYAFSILIFLHFLYEKNAKLCLESLHIMRQDRSLSSFSSLNLDVVGHSAVLHNPLLHNDWLAIKRETVPI